MEMRDMRARQPARHTDPDSAALARAGKKQVLRRNFAFLSVLSFSCTVLSTWEGVLVLFATGFINGGPAALVFQFLLVWIGTLCTFISIAELASMAPAAGGQYHWVYMLAPKPMRNFMSYVTAWMTILAWIATVATGAYLSASMIQSVCIVNWEGFAADQRPYQLTLMTWAVVLACVLCNTVVASLLPRIESLFFVLHVLGFFAILIPLVYYSPKGDASVLFSTRLNQGQWPTYGLSFMVGTLGSAFSFVGADAAMHMAEEVTNAPVNVPRSIVASIIVNGTLGLAMLLTIIFCMGDPAAALEAQDTIGYPFIEIFIQGTGSLSGSTIMASILIALGCSATVGFLATASRIIWSFARDNGLPFSSVLSRLISKAVKVHERSRVPLYAIAVASIVPCGLTLINVGSLIAFNGVTSLALVGFYSTYFLSLILLLCRRLGSSIRSPGPTGDTAGCGLIWGPWHVPGWLGVANNALSCAYLLVIWSFGFFPSSLPVTQTNMNYSSVVFGATVMYSLVYYVIWARKSYDGPVIEISA